MNGHGWLTYLAGKFLVFDGPDGSGKTTQFRRFATACRDAGLDVCEVREPGGTAVGERIRNILLDPIHHDMSLRCEMMLYMASRAQLVEQKIRPSLDKGCLVLADRFVSSTLAYQGTAGGLPVEDIDAVARVAIAGAEPDLVVLFDVDQATAARRLGLLLDRMEAKGAEFHARVRQGYLDQATRDPEHHLVIDGTQGEADVWSSLLEALRKATIVP